MWFEVISSLKINVDKTKVIPIEEVANMEELALVLGYRIGKLLFTYLDFPLGTSYKSMRVWDTME